MTELALPPLVAIPLLIELTQHSLRIDPEWHLLHLYGLEQVGGFPLRLLGGGFLFLALCFFGVLLFLFGRFGGCGLRFYGLDLFLGLGTFFLRNDLEAGGN